MSGGHCSVSAFFQCLEDPAHDRRRQRLARSDGSERSERQSHESAQMFSKVWSFEPFRFFVVNNFPMIGRNASKPWKERLATCL
jgi:hypothetical protein